MTDTERERINEICKVAGVTEIDDLSDGFHTFRQLYYQRMILFAAIVRQNKDKAWKSLRHEDGELCFGGGWFIVGIDTPEGSYTYHYENKYFDLFDCEILDYSKHWDGHTEKDVTRLLSLPVQPDHIAESDRKVSISCGQENDLISRQAAIDALDIAIERYDEIAEKYRKKADIERNDYMDMRDNAYEAQQLAQWLNELKYLREKIEQITIKTEPKWIPCSERLPEKNCRCLTTNEAWGSFEVDWNAWIDGRWLYPNEKPIAWMPLPEPYRGGETE